MSKKRIMQLIGDLEPGGAENIVTNLARDINNSKYDVIICSRKGGALLSNSNGVRIEILSKKGLVDLCYLIRLCRFIRRNNVDIIHSHLFGNNLYGFLASTLTRRKILFTIHGEDCFRSKKRKFFYRVAAPFVSKMVGVSEPLVKGLVKEVGVGETKIELIRNGIATSQFQREIDKTAKKKELGLPLDSALVGSVGNIKPVKGYDILLRAVSHIRSQEFKTYFLIVGGIHKNETYFEKLKALSIREGVQKNICFLGKKDDVKDILQVLDIYVMPSRSEGTPISLLEAMASGKPIVATNVGGVSHIIEHGLTGILVPPEDPLSLADAILTLLKEPSFARNLADQARRVAEERFGISQMTEKYLALYEKILND